MFCGKYLDFRECEIRSDENGIMAWFLVNRENPACFSPPIRYIITRMRNEQKELIVKLREGDPAAFRVLYQETGRMLYQYALYKLNGNSDAAEDVVADAFADALDHATSLTLNHNLKAWLYRIAHAKTVDYVRKQARRGAWVQQTGPLVAEEQGDDSPEQQAVKEEDKRLIRAAFFKMDGQIQELLREKYHEGLSIRDMAEKRGKTEKSVESLLYRAKKVFGDVLDAMGREKVYLSEKKEGAWESLFQIIF
jgi:RNA polymerase sigma factor (sigma-70 family)